MRSATGGSDRKRRMRLRLVPVGDRVVIVGAVIGVAVFNRARNDFVNGMGESDESD